MMCSWTSLDKVDITDPMRHDPRGHHGGGFDRLTKGFTNLLPRYAATLYEWIHQSLKPTFDQFEYKIIFIFHHL